MSFNSHRTLALAGATICIALFGAFFYHQDKKEKEWECLQRIEYTGTYRLDGEKRFKTQEEAMEYCLAKLSHEVSLGTNLPSSTLEYEVADDLHPSGFTPLSNLDKPDEYPEIIGFSNQESFVEASYHAVRDNIAYLVLWVVVILGGFKLLDKSLRTRIKGRTGLLVGRVFLLGFLFFFHAIVLLIIKNITGIDLSL